MGGTPQNNRLINYRPLLFAAVGFVAGVGYCMACGASPRVTSAGGLTLASITALLIPVLVMAAAIFGSASGRRWLFVLCMAFLLGAARTLIAAPDELSADRCTVTGTVVSVTEEGGSVKLVLRGAECSGVRLRYRILLKAETPAAKGVTEGDIIRAECTDLRVPSGGSSAFSERLTRLSEGISQRADATGIAVLSRDNAPLLQLSLAARHRLEGVISRVFGRHSALVSAFLLGQKQGVSEEIREDFAAVGTAHLLALSGFHVGLLTALLFFVLPKRMAWGRVLFVGLFLLAYCAVVGFSASITRASVMCMCALIAAAAERRTDPLSSLSLAALIILAVSPYKLAGLGFRLSFAATLGIILIVSLGRADTPSILFNRVADYAVVSFGAVAATMLITTRSFGVFSTYVLAANLVCVPLFSVGITLSFVLTLLGLFLPDAAAVLAAVPNFVFDAALKVMGRIAGLPFARLEAPPTSVLSSVLLLLTMFAASAYVLRPLKKRVLYASILLLLFTASLFADIIRL